MMRTDCRAFLRYATGFGLSGAGLALLSSACGVLAGRTAAKLPRLGYLCLGPREAYAARVDAFVDGLRDLGYLEGQTIAIEWRFTPRRPDAPWSKLAAELVGVPVDVLVVESSTEATLAAREATNTIPIVSVNNMYPVEGGLVASLARPGGNLTSLAVLAPGEEAKHADLLRQVMPGLRRTVALVDTNIPVWPVRWDEFRRAAESAGIQAERVDLQFAADVEAAFELPEVRAAQALRIMAEALLFLVRERVAQVALQHRLLDIATSSYAEVGLLMNYGANITAVSRRAASYFDKILKGAKPAELPVELPTVFDFAVNANTAAPLGITIPPDVAAQVTQWIS